MSDDCELQLDGRSISEMKVVELKEELGKRGLSKIGNKNTLYDRLKEFLMEDGTTVDDDDKQTESVSHDQDVRNREQELSSPPNSFVAEYRAKQQTALREARKDAEAVRRGSSGDDASPTHEVPAVTPRRSRRIHRDSGSSDINQALKTAIKQNVISEAEQETQGGVVETTKKSKRHRNESDLPKTKNEEAEKVEEGVDLANTVDESQDDGGDLDRKSVEELSVEDDNEAASERTDDDRSIDTEHTENEAEKAALSREIIDDQPLTELAQNRERMSDSSSQRSESAEKEKSFEIAHENVETIIIESSGQTLMTDDEYVASRRDGHPKATNIPLVNESKIDMESTLKQEDFVIQDDISQDKMESHSIEANLKGMTDSKDKMEELDYEEPVPSSTVIAEVAAEKKVSGETVSRHSGDNAIEKRAKRLEKYEKYKDDRGRKPSPTVEQTSENRLTVDGFVRERSVSPARYPVNQVIMIRQLTRPFTVKQLQSLLKSFGNIVDEGFWIDNIKSTCITKFSTIEEAIVARGRLHNVVWPTCSPKALKVDYTDDANLQKHINNSQVRKDEKDDDVAKKIPSVEKAAATLKVSVVLDQEKKHSGLSRGVQSSREDEMNKNDHEQRKRKRSSSPKNPRNEKRVKGREMEERRRPRTPEERGRAEPERTVKTADELFMKTKTQPAIYYFPLTEEVILERTKRKAAEAELMKKISQLEKESGSKVKEDDETNLKEKSSSKRVGASPTRRRSRSPAAYRGRNKFSRSRSPRRRR